MPRVIRDTLISARELLVTAGPFLLLALVLLAGAYYFLKPAPPKRVVLATGSGQGAYEAFGKRYQAELKRNGIEVVLRPSAGSRENLRLLRDPKSDVQIAFVQGGSSPSQPTPEQEKEAEDMPLLSLGSMFYEPVWLFYRDEAAKKLNKEGVIGEISQLHGLRVNTGVRGSGIPGVMNRLLEANLMNRAAALDRLHEIVESAARVPKTRKATKPTRSSKRKRLEGKIRRGRIKALRGKVGPEG